MRWAQRFLAACAVVLLGYCAYVLVDARLFQHEEQQQLARQLTDSPPQASTGLIGRMEIPRLGLSVMVMEGTTTTTLRRAAGHIEGTAEPGQPGNIGISGHRDTFFRPLRKIEPNDLITLTTLAGEFRYRVVSSKVVSPDDVSVLDPGQSEVLTLVTCYPFYFVGPAPSRFIVRATRIA
jgi:sortase A